MNDEAMRLLRCARNDGSSASLTIVPNGEVSDTTGDATCTTAGLIKKIRK